MKAISLWQPWASLVAHGLKRYETRSWSTKYRGPLAIHAAKTPRGWRSFGRELVPLYHAAGITLAQGPSGFPHGAIVAVVDLLEVTRMTPATIAAVAKWKPDEIVAGDWQPGRFAWRLGKVRWYGQHDVRGAQGLWNVKDWNPVLGTGD